MLSGKIYVNKLMLVNNHRIVFNFDYRYNDKIVDDGFYELIIGRKILSRFCIKDGDMYGNCMYYGSNGIKYTCTIRNPYFKIICENDKNEKIYAVVENDRERCVEIIDEKKYKTEINNNNIRLENIRCHLKLKIEYKYKLFSTKFYYTDRKVYIRENKNTTIKYYKNGYIKSFYRNKILFFY